MGSKDSDDNDSTAKKTATGKNINDYIEYELLLFIDTPMYVETVQ